MNYTNFFNNENNSTLILSLAAQWCGDWKCRFTARGVQIHRPPLAFQRAYFTPACMGSLQVLKLPPTAQTHACMLD